MKNKIINILKIVFLSVVAMFVLTYLTYPKKDIIKNSEDFSKQKELYLSSLPKSFEVYGRKDIYNTNSLINEDKTDYIIVLSHDSLEIFSKLDRYIKDDIVLIANISNTPWIVKKLAVDGKLTNLYKDSKNTLVDDSNGLFLKALNIQNSKQNEFYVFKVNKDKSIKLIIRDRVPLNSLEKGLSKEKQNSILLNLANKMKK